MILSLVGTGWMAPFMRAHGRSQPDLLVMDSMNVAVPQHTHKSGTPTMGGLAILGAAAVGYLVSHLRKGVVFSNQTLIMWAGVLAMAGIGFIDDFIKVRSKHNRGAVVPQGLDHVRRCDRHRRRTRRHHRIHTRLLTRAAVPGWELGDIAWVLRSGSIVFATH